MIDAMAGHVLMESGDLPAAIARFEQALKRGLDMIGNTGEGDPAIGGSGHRGEGRPQ